ncbi:MAG: putative two-component hybrid sensor and regulator, partial [Acidimicrobiales bacterium]|nr:putative two-component hybrid sensor and regulator [Acidimicrobiales bacterium]
AAARAGELRLVARSGRLLQRSLDIADILPMFAVELSDELDLDGIAISRVSSGGELVTAFAFGALLHLPRDPASIPAPRADVDPGEELTLTLLRGDRVIGALTVRAGKSGLGRGRTEALQAVSELLAAALANARIYQEEQAVVGRLRELDRMKTTFLGSVSHELRTTVTAIKGFAQLLTRPGLDIAEADRTDYLQRIDRNANSLAVLVDDLLDFASLERQSLAVTPQAVNLSHLLPDVVKQTSSIMANHSVSTAIEPGIVAVADTSAVERIVFNLLTNAAKYTPPGTEVVVALSRRGPKAVLTVTDRGPGIPASEQTQIFDRFYRVDNVATRAARGVGIGLALVRELVGLLNGTVVCEDTPGGGTRFVVELTLVDTDPTAPPSRTQLQPT